jgi:hypothetical protein
MIFGVFFAFWRFLEIVTLVSFFSLLPTSNVPLFLELHHHTDE